ncbi:hypothetical protein B296_00014148 [Ensete ventricosum]|uniref:Uncharacterized protein n=1 Tax=Ensete ventricosum TaxID=4639 RepID=A0A426YMU7_ENSVE|nr:hypothetical protein B296_00014148 [Ensete ventricosum]
MAKEGVGSASHAEGGGDCRGGRRRDCSRRQWQRWWLDCSLLHRQRVGSRQAEGGDNCREGDGSNNGRGGVRLRWIKEKGQGDGNAGGPTSEGCAAVAVTVAAILLVSSTKLVSGCGMTLAVGLCEVVAQSIRKSCSIDRLWKHRGSLP